MATYRRNLVPGATYFFTVALQDRRSGLLVDHVDTLRQIFSIVRARHPFDIDAIVILPDHLHTIWTLPPDDIDYPMRWNLIKGSFSKFLPHGESRSASRAGKRERGIWQRRFWEHTIRDDADFAAHMDYVHFNPVKHGYVERAADWELSSFRRCVERGLYPAEWGQGVDISGEFGE